MGAEAVYDQVAQRKFNIIERSPMLRALINNGQPSSRRDDDLYRERTRKFDEIKTALGNDPAWDMLMINPGEIARKNDEIIDPSDTTRPVRNIIWSAFFIGYEVWERTDLDLVFGTVFEIVSSKDKLFRDVNGEIPEDLLARKKGLVKNLMLRGSLLRGCVSSIQKAKQPVVEAYRGIKMPRKIEEDLKDLDLSGI